MTVLGIRNTSSCIRYAILKKCDTGVIFHNKETETKMTFPKGINTDIDKLAWAKAEFDRILSNQGPFDFVAIKQHENTKTTYSGVKLNAYLDSAVILSAKESHFPVETFVNKTLGTNRDAVKTVAESITGKTKKYWDTNIADAIVAAHHVITNA